jgi:hypothetical protein
VMMRTRTILHDIMLAESKLNLSKKRRRIQQTYPV